ncbi:MAG: hypothetical protein BWK72_19440 [Rhodoferax ferrireducens]|uniref:Uncharacterized protein n=1 Tax=Rhodoferax ferrireducens TaxID=192843 RepID=A0A1W9KP93_9BURK|nr:MAG: hypothetical protein BWK72_19440 [Rhodoferax ferrireducens]
MKFTDYVVTETTGSSVDPLGYLKPSGVVSSKVFRQFTVLSNHPAYQGFLAFAFSYLAERSITPSKRDFARRVRDLEILWGILNVRAGDSVVNITKFDPLANLDSLRLSQVRQRPALYARLNYGVLGHYASPSALWKILEPGATGLTGQGDKLATAWRYRKGSDFTQLADQWLNDDDLFAIKDIESWQTKYRLSAIPENSEKVVWQSLINEFCAKDPIIASLWQKPVPQKILDLSSAEGTYPLFFPTLQTHYAGHDELCRRIERCNRFERLSGLVQFAFEWEYVRRMDEIRVVGLTQGNLPAVVAREIANAATKLLPEPDEKEFWYLPGTLSTIADHETMADAILAHHTRHQRSKGASPFISGDTIAVQDRVRAKEFVNFFDKMVSDPEQLVGAVQWRYHRNWHFGRAYEWQHYAGVA